MSNTIIQSLLRFLDRKFDTLPQILKNLIVILVAILICTILLYTSIAPTYIEGHLFIADNDFGGKIQGKDYILIKGNQEFRTNKNGYWMLPVTGFIPTKNTIYIKDNKGKIIGDFSYFGPKPIANAFKASNYDILIDPDNNNNITISNIYRKVKSLVNINEVYAQSIRKKSMQKNEKQVLPILVHLEGQGNIVCKDGDWCGTKGEQRRIEGFNIKLPRQLKDRNINLEYYCHIEGGQGYQGPFSDGEFCGTKGEERRLEGFKILLKGTHASQYNIYYQAHIEKIGDTEILENGEFAGTRGKSLRIEAIKVWLTSQNH
ncbi:MAG: hypothetical protein ACL93V_06065 [Candidatus Electrothrix sp. YB6]